MPTFIHLKTRFTFPYEHTEKLLIRDHLKATAMCENVHILVEGWKCIIINMFSNYHMFAKYKFSVALDNIPSFPKQIQFELKALGGNHTTRYLDGTDAVTQVNPNSSCLHFIPITWWRSCMDICCLASLCQEGFRCLWAK